MECANRQDINSYSTFIETLQFKVKQIANRAQTYPRSAQGAEL